MRTDLLTITMPVFERKEYFKQALESVLNQTIKCEVLVVDNNSSHTFFKDLCEIHNVRYIKNDSNIGLFPNWNKCMDLVNTDYGMIFQDDNLLNPHFVEEFVSTIEKHKSLDFYFTNFDVFDLSSYVHRNHTHVYPYNYMENGMKVIEYAITHKLGLPYSFIIKKPKFTSYFFECHGSNDWLWIYENIDNMTVFGNSKILLHYGTHAKQDSSNPDTHIKCMLSMSYIYSIMKDKMSTTNPQLFRAAKRREFNTFLYFLCISPSSYIKKFSDESHLYSEYFKRKVLSGISFQILAKIPYDVKWNLYRICRKLKLIQTP